MKPLLIICAFMLTAAAENEFTTANNRFANSIYKEVSKTQDGNFLVSPFSAETVLAFSQSGSVGETAEELRTALHLPNDKNKVENAIKALLPKLKSSNQYTLLSANKLYVKPGFSIKDGFKRAASDVYLADIESVDFEKNVEAARTMNKWVEEQTNDKIKNLINSDDLDEDTRSVLINALYFKSNWSNPFQLVATSKQNFYRSATDSVQVDTLHHWEEYFKYYECPHLKAQFLELPFKNEEASMVIVLPNEKNGLPNLEQNLDQVFTPPHHLTFQYLNVALPKFKIESRIKLNQVLKNLGVSKIFDEDQADLSGIAGKKGDLYVSKVAQKTYIDVSEEGVEAAAASFVVVGVPAMARIDVPKNFVADHPFIFYVKIKDLIIFAGRVTDPSK